MAKIKKNDEVIVITGKDKGRTGKVTEVRTDGRCVIGGINVYKKHVKPNPQKGEQGGILDIEMPIQLSNVAIYNAETKKADRVAYKVNEDGKKVRVYKSNGQELS